MSKIVECVPNFSEGHDANIINSIAIEIGQVKGIKLLNIDPDKGYNRTVITFVGGPVEVKEAAFRAIAKAAERIDMSRQRGVHPRIGATDVCPFVPIANVTVDECIAISRELGREVGERLGIPVYLYQESATRPERRELANIRKGEYEGLPVKLIQKEWKPDFGPAEFNERVKKSGATVIGARKLLIAYNVALDTDHLAIANKIAGNIRESGHVVECKRIPGRLKEVKAIGVLLEGRAWVSMNLTDYKVTPLHIAYEAIKKEAAAWGIKVLGSEIVGLVAKEPLIMAGRFYLGKDTEELMMIASAIKNLGLKAIKNFDYKKKIIEFVAGLE